MARDHYNDSSYWVIQGRQASVFVTDTPEATALYTLRDAPFALEYDWLTKRLFWVEVISDTQHVMNI